MIYYPDEVSRGSWADCALSCLGYNTPGGAAKLQLLIRRIFEMAVIEVTVPGSEVVGLPLFEALDGKDPRDYEQRVEPSARGGKKLADLILNYALNDATHSSSALSSTSTSTATHRDNPERKLM